MPVRLSERVLKLETLAVPNPEMSLTARSVAAPLKRVLVWMIDSCSFLFVFPAGRAGSELTRLWMTLWLLPVLG